MPRKIGFSTYAEEFPGSDITDDEWEFMKAITAYQKRWNRRYPSWREVLHIAICLGYRKVAAPQPFADHSAGITVTDSKLRISISRNRVC